MNRICWFKCTSVDDQNWRIVQTGQTGMHRPVRTGLTDQGDFAKMQIRLHHCVALVETIEMHMQNAQFGVQMRELWLLEDLTQGRTGIVDRSDRSKLHGSSLELYFDAGIVYNQSPDGVRPPLPINIKARPIEGYPIESIKHFYFFYFFFALSFFNLLLAVPHSSLRRQRAFQVACRPQNNPTCACPDGFSRTNVRRFVTDLASGDQSDRSV